MLTLYKDSGSPTISCSIRNHTIENVLLSLGVSVNLLPYSVFVKLGLEKLHPTPVVLQLADRFTKISRDIVEDVLIQVYKFYFPIDFIIIDTQPIQDSRTNTRFKETHPHHSRPTFLGNCGCSHSMQN